MAVHRLTPFGSSEYGPRPDQVFTDREVDLFSRVVAVAEKAGKHVELLAVPGRDRCVALTKTAQQLGSTRTVINSSPQLSMDEQARELGQTWEQLSAPRPSLSVEIVKPGAQPQIYSLGAHTPQLWPEDIDLVHQLWKELSNKSEIGAPSSSRRRERGPRAFSGSTPFQSGDGCADQCEERTGWTALTR